MFICMQDESPLDDMTHYLFFDTHWSPKRSLWDLMQLHGYETPTAIMEFPPNGTSFYAGRHWGGSKLSEQNMFNSLYTQTAVVYVPWTPRHLHHHVRVLNSMAMSVTRTAEIEIAAHKKMDREYARVESMQELAALILSFGRSGLKASRGHKVASTSGSHEDWLNFYKAFLDSGEKLAGIYKEAANVKVNFDRSLPFNSPSFWTPQLARAYSLLTGQKGMAAEAARYWRDPDSWRAMNKAVIRSRAHRWNSQILAQILAATTQTTMPYYRDYYQRRAH
ncbi:MAG: hypothetical protein V2J10_00865 [Wenzhouxiangella sp.]|jgi:hypothetical protein|nr:hypothetical protein [Wenzhouxiangella sp.]